MPHHLSTAQTLRTGSKFLGAQLGQLRPSLQQCTLKGAILALYQRERHAPQPRKLGVNPWPGKPTPAQASQGVDVGDARERGGSRKVPGQTFELTVGFNADRTLAKRNVTLGFTKDNELFVGRLAMFGIAASLIGELITGQGALAQLGMETGLPLKEIDGFILMLIAFNFAAALAPTSGKFVPEEDFSDRPAGPVENFLGFSRFGFTKANELFIGRLAQLGFAGSLLGEALTGRGLLQQITMETGLPTWEVEPLLAVSIAFTLFAAFNPGTGRFSYDGDKQPVEDDFDEDYLSD